MSQAAYDVIKFPTLTSGATNTWKSAKVSNYGDFLMTPGNVELGAYQKLTTTNGAYPLYPFTAPGFNDNWGFINPNRGRPDWLQHGHHLIDLAPATSAPWYVQSSISRSGDFNAPELYAVGRNYGSAWQEDGFYNAWQYFKERNPYKYGRPDDEKWLDVTLRHHRRLLESIVASEVEVHGANSSFNPGETLAPWIALPGSGAQADDASRKKDASLGGCAIVSRVLPLLRSKGVKEFMVWDDVPVASRNDKVIEFKDWYRATFDPYFTYARIVDSGLPIADESDWPPSPSGPVVDSGTFRASRLEDTLPSKQSGQWSPYTLRLAPRYSVIQRGPNLIGQWIPAMFEVRMKGLPQPGVTQFQSQAAVWDGTVSFVIEGWVNGTASELDNLLVRLNIWNYGNGLEAGWTPLQTIDSNAYAGDYYGDGVALSAPTRNANNQVTNGAGRRDFRRTLRAKLLTSDIDATFIDSNGEMRIQVTALILSEDGVGQAGFESINFDLLQVVPVVGTCPEPDDEVYQQLSSPPPTALRVISNADFNQDSDVDTNDISFFLEAYELAIPHADQNADGQVDVADVVQFITDYANTGGN